MTVGSTFKAGLGLGINGSIKSASRIYMEDISKVNTDYPVFDLHSSFIVDLVPGDVIRLYWTSTDTYRFYTNRTTICKIHN